MADQIDILIGNRLFTTYIFSENEKYPYYFPVNGPSGGSVTSKRNSNFPHYSSLFFGCDFVNGGNYWQEGLERGQIISIGEDILESSGDFVVIENECIWTRPGAPSTFRDIRTISILEADRNIYQLDVDIALEALVDVNIRRTNHSLFSGRMAIYLAVVNGGTMVNSLGDKGEKETFGVPSPLDQLLWKSSGKNRRYDNYAASIEQMVSITLVYS